MMSEDFSKLGGELYKSWEQSMTSWWDQVLESPTFLAGLGKNLEAQTRARGNYEEQVDEMMSNLHLPSRKDVVRLARIASLLEDRILQMEDHMLKMGDQLDRIEKEVLRARVAAAEALVTAKDGVK
ncbi:MAG: hypothetical protein HN348_22565 [Proteobacteria bacterium]|nr:hypothetical protein [Pseudomonadota bacterium]